MKLYIKLLMAMVLILVLSLAQSQGQDKSKATKPQGTGQRVIKVEGGRKAQPNVFVSVSDSTASDTLAVDSTGRPIMMADSLGHRSDSTSLFIGSSTSANALLQRGAKADTVAQENELNKEVKRRFRLTKDTISAGSVTLISMVAPGFGQFYNKQWWKAPIIYVGLGGFITAGVVTQKRYDIQKENYARLRSLNMPSEILDRAKVQMDQTGTLRTAMFSMAALTYLYSVTDATFNYRGKADPIRKATTLAALFPGAGFIYTQNYWRLPIYYGAFAALATVIDYNGRSYTRYNQAYKDLTDNNPTTIDEFKGRYSADMLKNVKDSYRRNRDLAIIGTVAVYLISIIDTHVFATLKNWDMSDDLSVNVEPALIDNSRQHASSLPVGVGVSLKLTF